MNELTFKSQKIIPVIVNNLPYLTATQVGAALNYARPDKINSIYQSHRDEFADTMTFTTDLVVQGQNRQVRVFSLRGCHLLAMFSKTPVAKEFRRWVLDLIEQQNQPVTNCHQLDAKAIGGIVKRCTVSAFREAIMDIMTAAEQPDFFGEVKDDDLIRAIWGWYAGHHKKTFEAIREITRENDELKCKLATIKKAVA